MQLVVDKILKITNQINIRSATPLSNLECYEMSPSYADPAKLRTKQQLVLQPNLTCCDTKRRILEEIRKLSLLKEQPF